MHGIKGLHLWRAALAICALWCLVGCAPEVGSERWCDMMRDKPRGDWTGNEALDFTRNCLFEGGD